MLTNTKEAWDSYIQNGNAIDPSSFQYYPTNVDQMNPEGQQADPSAFGNSVFMGAGPNTPGR